MVAEAIQVMYRGRREMPLPVRVRDELGELFADEQFVAAFGTEGRPGWSPGRLALITVLQRVENLTDRRAAEAVRTDLSWKYALGLELDDPGFDASVLSEFRSRVIAHGLEERVLDLLLETLQARGLVKAGGKQRTDATHVISAVRDLNRVELAGECVRAALEALAAAAPGWVEQVLEVPDWADRYRARVDSWRLPASKAKQEQLARAYGADGYALCAALYAPFSPAWLRELPAVQALRVMLIQNFVRTVDARGREVVERRRSLREGGTGLPPGRHRLASPYDPDTRWSAKADVFWNGYKVHISETCATSRSGEDGDASSPPNLITNVATTDATVADMAMTASIHQGLQRRDLLPAEHYVDSGYATAELIVSARDLYGLALVAPVRFDSSPQARAATGYGRAAFTIDWTAKQATCPQGQTSISWTPTIQRGLDTIVVRFSAKTCTPCPARTACTSSTSGRRQITLRHTQAQQQALDAARTQQSSQDWQHKYKIRAGVEGTIRQAVAITGIRRARYRGLRKVHLEHVISATALNLTRLDAWWNGHPLDRTRTSHLARLDQTLAV